MGSRINQAKEKLEAALDRRRDAIQEKKLEAQLIGEALDVTLPGRGTGMGGTASRHAYAGAHPVIISFVGFCGGVRS